MSSDEYIRSILEKYKVLTGPGSRGYTAAQQLCPLLQRWAGQYLINIGFSGSYAKGTAVSCATDVDLFVSLSSSTPGTLEDIYCSLFKAFSGNGFAPRTQNVSIGLSYNGVSVDIVPGRQQSPYTSDHSLYRSKARTWTKTNVDTHVSTIRNCGRVEEIRAIKIWRSLRSLDFPSFYLELTVIEALHGRARGQLAENVAAGLRYIADYLPSARVVDPANTNNVISEDLTYDEKAMVSAQAKDALGGSWGQVLY
jgi:hypothetical protein